ncbi:hypothetical protein [Actinoplanes philippinensis]|uniref:hypothetical protein n=1 Tax=Actinoplanes philippinensis TaxID=35752 RepID=UPI0033C8EB28
MIVLLEHGESRLDVVARRSGLGTATNLRAPVCRETGRTPGEHRHRFSRHDGPGRR